MKKKTIKGNWLSQRLNPNNVEQRKFWKKKCWSVELRISAYFLRDLHLGWRKFWDLGLNTRMKDFVHVVKEPSPWLKKNFRFRLREWTRMKDFVDVNKELSPWLKKIFRFTFRPQERTRMRMKGFCRYQ